MLGLFVARGDNGNRVRQEACPAPSRHGARPCWRWRVSGPACVLEVQRTASGQMASPEDVVRDHGSRTSPLPTLTSP